jgi:hypothetical protein
MINSIASYIPTVNVSSLNNGTDFDAQLSSLMDDYLHVTQVQHSIKAMIRATLKKKGAAAKKKADDARAAWLMACKEMQTVNLASSNLVEKMKRVEMMDNDEEEEGDNKGESSLGDLPPTTEPRSPSSARRTEGYQTNEELEVAASQERVEIREIEEKPETEMRQRCLGKDETQHEEPEHSHTKEEAATIAKAEKEKSINDDAEVKRLTRKIGEIESLETSVREKADNARGKRKSMATRTVTRLQQEAAQLRIELEERRSFLSAQIAPDLSFRIISP